MKTVFNSIVSLKKRLGRRLIHLAMNCDESRVTPYTLPDPLRFIDGRVVTGVDDWQKKRRPEIISIFRKLVYGDGPKDLVSARFQQMSKEPYALGGLATRKEVTLFFTNQPNVARIPLLMYLPNNVSKPMPAFLGLNFQGNHTIHTDPGIMLGGQWRKLGSKPPAEYIFPSNETRGIAARRWPLTKILLNGYALVTAYYGDIEPDFPDGRRYGIRLALSKEAHTDESLDKRSDTKGYAQLVEEKTCEPPKPLREDWGTIGVWAWGLSRILDYLEQDPDIYAPHVILFGHSRLGKTALWAGAQDERFAIVISNNSGCGGASLYRRRFGETIRLINRENPRWFCANFKTFNDKEDQLPLDQHMLIALLAPRPVYIASAEQDLTADPFGEFLAAKHADPVFSLFGLKGLGEEQMPNLNKSVGETIGYHIRAGKHDVTDFDWDQYIRFANRHLGKVSL